VEKLEAGGDAWHEARQIDEAASRGAVLVRQLLAFSRKQVLAPRDVQANEVVSSVRGMLQRSIGEDIEFRCELAPDLGWIRVDTAQLEQVLVNLVLNARDAMPDGGTLTLSTSNVAVEWEDSDSLVGLMPGEHVEITVSDTGVGMDAETRSHVFEPFYTTKEVGKGTGLGMATAYGIVRQSGGSIVIDSRPGAGTTVHVYLPRVEAPPEAAATTQEIAAPAIPDADVGAELKATVLVVEDDRHIRKLLTAVLGDNGYEVLIAENGAVALELVENNGCAVDLLLTDVVMPGIGGPELAERLAAMNPGLKVLFMSGYSEEIVSSRLATEGGMLLEKPFSLPALLQRVGEALER